VKISPFVSSGFVCDGLFLLVAFKGAPYLQIVPNHFLSTINKFKIIVITFLGFINSKLWLLRSIPETRNETSCSFKVSLYFKINLKRRKGINRQEGTKSSLQNCHISLVQRHKLDLPHRSRQAVVDLWRGT